MPVDPFRVALSASFRSADGSATYPSFDLTPLNSADTVDMFFLPPGDPLRSEDLEDVDALILLSERFTADSVPDSGRLSLVARFGVGYDSVDVESCTTHNIAVSITPDGVRRPVAVSILTLMLALSGKLLIKDQLTRRGPEGFNARSQYMGVGLEGLTLGSLGLGNIGSEMFRVCKPLDMRFVAFDPYADSAVTKELGVELLDIDKVFSQSDVLAVNCPLTDDTHHLVNADTLSRMKPTALLINTARGPIVDQRALTEALQAGQIAGAGLDVFETEPPDANDPLFALDNVIVTPHALCWTDQCFAGIGASTIASTFDVKAGAIPRGLVNQQVSEQEGFKTKLAKHQSQPN